MRAEGWGRSGLWRLITGGAGVGDFKTDPEVLEQITPVLIVGDASRASGRVWARQGTTGINAQATASNFTAWVITPYGPGGCLVSDLLFGNPGGISADTTSASNLYRWGILPASGGQGLIFPADQNRKGPGGGPMTTKTGTRTATTSLITTTLGTTEVPMLVAVFNSIGAQVRFSPNSPYFASPGGIYVPPGSSFVLEGNQVATGIQGGCVITEFDDPQTVGNGGL